MNARSSKLFSKLLDVNWALTEAKEPLIIEALGALYDKVEDELKEEMGAREYREFVNQGRKMFGIS